MIECQPSSVGVIWGGSWKGWPERNGFKTTSPKTPISHGPTTTKQPSYSNGINTRINTTNSILILLWNFESWSYHQGRGFHCCTERNVFKSNNNSSLFGLMQARKFEHHYYCTLGHCPQVEYQLANFEYPERNNKIGLLFPELLWTCLFENDRKLWLHWAAPTYSIWSCSCFK